VHQVSLEARTHHFQLGRDHLLGELVHGDTESI